MSLLPSVKPIASAARPPGHELLIPFSWQLRKYSRLPQLRQHLYDLSEAWPYLAAGIKKVHAKDLGDDYAHASTFCMTTVEGVLQINKRKLLNPLSEVELLGLRETNALVGDCWEDILTHEWGHLLFQVPIHRRYPSSLEAGYQAVLRRLEKASGISGAAAARKYSQRASMSIPELLAEGFVFCEKYGAASDSFSRELYRLASELWIPGPLDYYAMTA